MKKKIKIFCDTANILLIKKYNKHSLVKGFTTNPSLMKLSGAKNYENYSKKILKICKDKPISFEVFSDDLNVMEEQAMEIFSWGKNVNVKIPITNTKGESTTKLIGILSERGVICNVTAIFTTEQIEKVVSILNPSTPAILSVFAGRIADSGIDPFEIMKKSVHISKSKPKTEILWASTREIINIFQAEKSGCQIITVPHELLKKLSTIGKDLKNYSLETVLSFYNDAKEAGYSINKSIK